MQADSARAEAKPDHPVFRAVSAGGGFALLAVIGLLLFPTAMLIALFVLGPAGSAFLFAGRPWDRETFLANGYVSSFASGATSAIWIGLFAKESTATAAVAIGASVSFVLFGFIGALGCYILGRWLNRGRA